MSFELTDEESIEVQKAISKKLRGIKWVLEQAKNGGQIRGKETLEKRITIMEPLMQRLGEKYGNN